MTWPAVSNSAMPPPDPWWRYTQGCATALVGGVEPPTVTVYGPIIDDDERPRLCTTAGISRLVCGDGSYQRSSLLLLGTPGLTLGLLAAQGLVNHRRRQQARRDQIPAWRLHRLGTVIVTDQRIMCSGIDGTLLDFWFGAVTEFYPDLASRAVVLAFSEQCQPLRIDGPAAPAIALWIAVGLYGDRWVEDQRLYPLTSGALRHRPAVRPL